VFPLRKFYTEEMFVLVCMQLRSHEDAQPAKALQVIKWLYDNKFGMLQVRKNEISLRKYSDGAAHL